MFGPFAAELIIFKGRILFKAGAIQNEPHRHFSASIIISLQKKINVWADKKSHLVDGIMVAPNVEQALLADGPVLNLQVDPELPEYRSLQHLMGKRKTLHVKEDIVESIRELPFWDQEIQVQDAEIIWGEVIRLISSFDMKDVVLDERIEKACRLMQQDLLNVPAANSLSEMVGLSESRFLHLFTENKGLTWRSYVKW